MDKKKTPFLLNAKAVDLWGDDLSGWSVYSGDIESVTEAESYKFIPTMYRAVQIRAYSVSTMPFILYKGTKEYDISADWENKVGFMPNPTQLLQLIESALVMAGTCYLFRERSAVTTKILRYHLPNSVTPMFNKSNGEIEYFERPVNGVQKHFKPDDYVYFWPADPYVERGPANNYPARAAANSCGVMLNMDIFASNFFERGAIKTMLLTVKGMPSESERTKLELWWSRVVSGIKNAFGAKVINAEAVTPVVVGEGMKELENVTIGQEKREDVAIALGIPMSILFANAANYATSQQDELNFLNKTIIPECEFIASVLNEQIFEPLGLHWEFQPDTLDAMQEDEVARAQALKDYVGVGFPLLMACDILGVELTKEQRAELEEAEAEKEKKAEELAKQMAQQPPAQEQVGEEEEPDEEKTDTTFKAELDRWKRKALNAMKKGKPANVDFVSTIIPEQTFEIIMSSLGNAVTPEDVKQAFIVTQSPKPEFESGIMALAAELRRANDLLEKSE